MNNSNDTSSTATFDPQAKERQLKSDSDSWDTSAPEAALPNDIPVINLEEFFTSGSSAALQKGADELRIACEEVGFFSIVGHQVPARQIDAMFEITRKFHALPAQSKRSILMDRADWPLGGVGYLPIKNKKLPARDKGNLNEAFIVKCDHSIGFDDNQWPPTDQLPEFRKRVEDYARALETLGKRLLPIFATALEMPATYFDEAFDSPLYRLRMTHYPPVAVGPADEFGIAPHVDTTFCTILAQDQPGLTIFSERRQKWIQAPLIKNAFIVNSGELLKHWTNDRFISVKHFANNNTGQTSRYSIPFFLNANSNYRMACISSCCSDTNPARYPPISYAESQAAVQGE